MMAAIGVILATIVFVIFVWAAVHQPAARIAVEHKRGPRLSRGTAAIAAAFSAECRAGGGEGIPLVLGGPRFSRRRETMHVIVTGATGSGKTTILAPMIEAAIARGDRAMILDAKHEFTSDLNLPQDCEPLIFDPMDQRSIAWSPSTDMANRVQRSEWAASIMPAKSLESSNSYFYFGAISILSWCAEICEQRSPRKWSLADLCDAVTELARDREKFTECHHDVDDQAAALTRAKEFPSIFSTLTNQLIYIRLLAEAWRNRPLFSFRQWALQDDRQDRIIIIRPSAEYAHLTRAAIAPAVRIVAVAATGPGVPNNDHRLWMFLDEISSLGAGGIPGFKEIMVRGRSKGCRIVAGTQMVQDLTAMFGEVEAEEILGNFGTYIICGSLDQKTQEWASKTLGIAEVDEIHQPRQENRPYGTPAPASTATRTQRALLLPAEIAGLGAGPDGVTAAVRTQAGSYIVKWPFWAHQERRPAFEAAGWLDDSPALEHPAAPTPSAPEPAQEQAQEPPPPSPTEPPVAGIRIQLRRPGR